MGIDDLSNSDNLPHSITAAETLTKGGRRDSRGGRSLFLFAKQGMTTSH
jgi:hypothetical protein